MTGNAKSERLREGAIIALLNQPTIAAAAKSARVGEATLWRWLQTPEFQAAYRRARREAVAQATAQLQQASGAAVGALVEIVQDRKAPTSSRVAAARAVLEFGQRAIELEDVVDRLEALERKIQEGTES